MTLSVLSNISAFAIRTIVARSIAILAALFVAVGAMAQTSPESFGALPYISEAAISPDGKKVAMLETRGTQTVVGIYAVDTQSGAKPKFISVGENKARDLLWGSNDYVLALVSASDTVKTVSGLETYEYFRYFSIHTQTGKSKILFSGDPGFGRILSPGQLKHRLPNDPDHVLVAQLEPASGLKSQSTGSRMAAKELGGWSVYRVSLKTGKERRIASGNPDTDEWVIGADGTPVLRIDYADREQERVVLKLEGKRAKELKRYQEARGGGTIFSTYGPSDDGVHTIVSAVRGGNTTGLYKLNNETGALGEAVYVNKEYDISGVQRDYDRGSVIGVSVTREFPETIYFDDDFKGLSAQMKKALKSDAVSLVSFSRDRNLWIVSAKYASKPSAFYLFDRGRKELSAIGSSYPWLENVALVREEFDYTTPDGKMIHGYLTRPKGQAKENLPLIVLPHGGPVARDDMSFDWWASFYAVNGYAVYQPNFRGSRGYGYDFRVAGRRQWGQLMQDDITNGVKKLIADGVVDGSRVCIVGASYGGYAALAGATLTPELYQCAVSVNGVSDLMALLGEESRSSEYSLAYWEVQIGDRFTDVKKIRSVSPVDQVANVRAPILLIHGRDDTVVPFDQSKRIEAALKKARKPVTLIELKGEDHWLSGAVTRTRMLTETMSFIAEHIGE